jgi:hypothetical protein
MKSDLNEMTQYKKLFKKPETLNDDQKKEASFEDRGMEEASRENLSSFTSSVSHSAYKRQVTSLKYEPSGTHSKVPVKRKTSENYETEKFESSLRTDPRESIENYCDKPEKEIQKIEGDLKSNSSELPETPESKGKVRFLEDNYKTSRHSKENSLDLFHNHVSTETDLKELIRPSPGPSLFSSCRTSPYYDLVPMLNRFNHIEESLWDRPSCLEKLKFTLCACCFKQFELSPSTEQEVFVLISFSETKFSLTNDFHTSLLFNYYQRLTLEETFENSPNTWKKLGFSNSNPKENELTNKTVLICLLFDLFLFEKNSQVLKDLLRKAKKFKCGVVLISILLMNESLTLLRGKKLNKLFAKESSKTVVELFFQFHCEFIVVWTELIKNNSFQVSIKKAAKRIVKIIKL